VPRGFDTPARESIISYMRCFVPAVLLAALLSVAGCSLFHDQNVGPAVVSSFEAPDSVHAGTAFDIVAHVTLGAVSGYVVDHKEVTRCRTYLSLRVWSRDEGEDIRMDQPTEVDIALQARPTVPGSYRLVAPAPYPECRDVERVVTVLP
jgi:hypothetical protein